MPSIRQLEQASEQERRKITAPLDAFSAEQGFAFRPRMIALALEDDETIVGGLIGGINWEWLHIEILAVPNGLRDRGHGRLLVERAEGVARERGCRGAWVDTFTFQAPGFYGRLGYTPFGELPDYPAGQRRIFFRKLFVNEARASPSSRERSSCC